MTNTELARSVGATVVDGGVLFIGYDQLDAYTQAAAQAVQAVPVAIAFPHSPDFSETKCPHCDTKFYVEREVCSVCGCSEHVAAHRPLLSGPNAGEPLDHTFVVQPDLNLTLANLLDLADLYANAVSANSDDAPDQYSLEAAEENARSKLVEALEIALAVEPK